MALIQALAGPLPGKAAQDLMTPECLDMPDYPLGDEGCCRRAAVLVLLHEAVDGLRFPLILRTDSPGPHGGQICLPGGALEDGESPVQAALRETEEEIGVGRGAVEVLGALSDIDVPSSGFRVTPFVGWRRASPGYRISESEVAAIFEARLGDLVDRSRRKIEEREVRGRRWAIPCFDLEGGEVWGATARILSELAEIARAALYPSPAA